MTMSKNNAVFYNWLISGLFISPLFGPTTDLRNLRAVQAGSTFQFLGFVPVMVGVLQKFAEIAHAGTVLTSGDTGTFATACHSRAARSKSVV